MIRGTRLHGKRDRGKGIDLATWVSGKTPLTMRDAVSPLGGKFLPGIEFPQPRNWMHLWATVPCCVNYSLLFKNVRADGCRSCRIRGLREPRL
jgi:hypothetical protein